MAAASGHDAAGVFDPLRPKLTRIAYRMLGSVADAEDVVQDAFIRWLETDRDAVREPDAFLRRVVTRLREAGCDVRVLSRRSHSRNRSCRSSSRYRSHLRNRSTTGSRRTRALACTRSGARSG